MAWLIDLREKAKKDFAALDKSIQRRVFQYLNVRIAQAENARSFGKPLRHSFSGLWYYLFGDYRIICKIEDRNRVVLVVEIGHRSDVYNN